MTKESEPIFLPADDADDAIKLFRRTRGVGFFAPEDASTVSPGKEVYRVVIKAERVAEVGKAK